MKKNSLDKSDLRSIILSSSKQFKEGFNLAKNIKIKGKFKSLEISGMGGSSLPANILRIFCNQNDKKKLAIFQNRFYSLPHEAYDNCLNFFASYSGNTEETISSFKEAIKKKLPSIGLATGGKLLELCQKNNTPCVILPKGIQPRFATGYFFAAMYQILVNMYMVKDETKKIIEEAEKLEKNIIKLESQGKKIANSLVKKTPVIYASTEYKALAMIWKIKINENAKTPAFYNFFPELNHNEMVGYTLPQGKFHVIMLMDKKDHPQNNKRMRTTALLLKKKDVSATIIEMPENGIFNKIFSTLALGDWASYYLALAYGQDPTPVDMVEDLKKMLA
ncbi:MAG: Bifunctional phosphoglucose/phosphomannose isomerase [Candidatus Falkowbacteria bacterium GW2011_GWC2_38_22]|uniref:Bifunctional phosphoglucose/phosphomannose isomerase n=1 Tax=Candidatus Falkowbacteria bacterium GW2011_GWE1_38_31 TaxID=1618638 RepID=A0A0G0MBS0_9BACT|nr:MAG: Bifunctional phosphoglucose/phosphomannose isomerase [Candidatus Falkowbacteria bacterium GW2011_GWF2_38_1205]KKQ61770.1 MAG: Bifunctional phosphoglucose/phosphomannose isomerase [Candidatus Falkowbacteria bacterium GW2011_GWC2_38_22]KKQ64078.1 MAG: Bifunctional phosphoglucose/phosphomannose isomerase [Candidatus Falkowbacteria bacterium GW2011_GWF1_38_22]KKQ66573.1 MAG: Bifunctional phosphoglucose/phosphomannose isomerase [Candidatus Falkowbacteria bacterium GW2011_GWE2_38_254]KKQ71184